MWVLCGRRDHEQARTTVLFSGGLNQRTVFTYMYMYVLGSAGSRELTVSRAAYEPENRGGCGFVCAEIS